jgi:hypothetical protein
MQNYNHSSSLSDIHPQASSMVLLLVVGVMAVLVGFIVYLKDSGLVKS